MDKKQQAAASVYDVGESARDRPVSLRDTAMRTPRDEPDEPERPSLVRRPLMRLWRAMRDLPPTPVLIIGLSLVILLWSIDRTIPNQVSLSIFYLLPVGFTAWFAGSRRAYIVSTASAAAWFINDIAIARTHTHWLVPYWNAFVRLGFFVIVSYLAALLSRMRRLNDAESSALQIAVESSELKSRMIAFVSHEYCNSLTTFKVALTMLKESDPAASGRERGEWYAVLERVFVHLSAASSNFLNLNRLQSGRFKPEPRRALLQPLIEGVLSVLRPIHEKNNVTVRRAYSREPIAVYTDPDALALIMSNLIGNALKYTPENGRVTIAVASNPRRPDVVEVSVADTGIGIPKKAQENIFSEYYRAEGGKAMAKGFGVGLKVVREFLDVQGIELKLESAPGAGTRFFFQLPVFRPEDDPGR